MKCPECGFECLPDDVECLACGVNIIAAGENKEKERIRSLQAAERKAKYEIELKKELGIISDDGDIAQPVTKAKTLEETFKKVPQCPKCGCEKLEGAVECSRCGIIYSKYKFAGKSASAPDSPQAADISASNGSPPYPSMNQKHKAEPSYPPQINESSQVEPDEKVEVLEDIDLSDLTMETKDERLALMDKNIVTQPPEPYDDDKTDEINIAGLGVETNAEQASDSEELTTAEPDLEPGEESAEAEPVCAADAEAPAEEASASEPDLEPGEESAEAEPVYPTDVEPPAEEASVSEPGLEPGEESAETEPVRAADVEAPAEEVTAPEPDFETDYNKTVADTENETDVMNSSEEGIPTEPAVVSEQEPNSEELSENISDHLCDPEAFEKTQIFEPDQVMMKPDMMETDIKSIPEPTIEFQEPPDESGADDKTEILSISKHSAGVHDISEKASKVSDYTKKVKALLIKTVESAGRYSGKALNSVKDVSGKLFNRFGQNGKRAKIVASVIVAVLCIAIVTPFLVNYYKGVKLERLEKEEIARIEAIRVDFITNRDAISKKIKRIIDNKQFDAARKEIDKYEIPGLQTELVLLKNYLREIQLYELVKKVPASEYEKNYSMFLELRALNPKSKLYKTKSDFYKRKYANREYVKARNYFKTKKNNVGALEVALTSIEKAIELNSANKKYSALKLKLETNKLLFYEGNKNIVMAVRDDGMGKRLYSGQRKITVWLRNISSETVYINVQYITMVGKNQKNYTYSDIGRKFKSKLLPGEQTRGELFFRTRTRPSKVLFKHLTSGEISRTFP